MKTFAEVRRVRANAAMHGRVVKKMKVGTHTVQISRDNQGKYHAHIDGDMLDKYLTLSQAEKMAREFIKQAEK